MRQGGSVGCLEGTLVWRRFFRGNVLSKRMAHTLGDGKAQQQPSGASKAVAAALAAAGRRQLRGRSGYHSDGSAGSSS